MKCLETLSRPNWRERVELQGFNFHSIDGIPYWVDSRAYSFNIPEIASLRDSTLACHSMCLQAVEYVIRNNYFDRLMIPVAFRPLIIKSWERADPSVYGRFDFSYHPGEPPKMLEYNADTPTALLESAVVQWYWLEDQKQSLNLIGRVNQFNQIQEKMIEAWKRYQKFHFPETPNPVIYFSAFKDFPEDRQTVEFMLDCARFAGIEPRFVSIEDIGWDPHKKVFFTPDDNLISHLFKLYPWEMMVREEFGKHLLEQSIKLIEPPWKMILSNKGILPVLWEMFEGHPNLLPSYFTPDRLENRYVKKPIFSREGANISIVDKDKVVSTGGAYGAEGHIYQEFKALPSFDGRYVMIGSWVVNDEAAGICCRESPNLITDNRSHFVPHYIVE